jgi:hypothetical protein
MPLFSQEVMDEDRYRNGDYCRGGNNDGVVRVVRAVHETLFSGRAATASSATDVEATMKAGARRR